MGFFATFWAGSTANWPPTLATIPRVWRRVLEPAVVTLATHLCDGVGLSASHRANRRSRSIAGLKRIAMMALILGVGLRLWLYNTVIVDTFYNAPAQLAAAMVGASDPVGTIDAIWNSGGAVAGNLWDKGGCYRVISGSYLAGAVVWCLIGVLCVYAMFLIALSSIALAVLLAFGTAVHRTAVLRCNPSIFYGLDRAIGQLRTHYRAHRDGGRVIASNRSILCRADSGPRHGDLDGGRAEYDVDRVAGVSCAAPGHAHCRKLGRRWLAQLLRCCRPRFLLGREKDGRLGDAVCGKQRRAAAYGTGQAARAVVGGTSAGMQMLAPKLAQLAWIDRTHHGGRPCA